MMRYEGIMRRQLGDVEWYGEIREQEGVSVSRRSFGQVVKKGLQIDNITSMDVQIVIVAVRIQSALDEGKEKKERIAVPLYFGRAGRI